VNRRWRPAGLTISPHVGEFVSPAAPTHLTRGRARTNT
jgi:hypothetical protein